jgi:nitrite reductase/ring-hydroxylating ferredoxin subunit
MTVVVPGLTRIAHIDDLPIGSIRLVKAEGRRLAVVRTSDGVFALDNACPHEGYGLVQGELRDAGAESTVTCSWHNWKFKLDDGSCVLGEEAARSYDITVADDGSVLADLTDPDPAELRPRLLDSLRSAIEHDYVGQMARDVVRLLRADASPGELVWEAIAYGAPRAEFGWGHAVASATDCLKLIDRFEGDERAMPIVQALAGVSETERRRPLRPQPAPATTLPRDPASAFRHCVETEALDDAEALVLGALELGATADELRPWFVGVVADHHLGYGHGAIYTQKAFMLLERLGWDRAATVLPHLVPTLGYSTREDKLPYMRPFMRALAEVDIDALATSGAEPAAGWRDDGSLRAALLGSDRRAPLTEAVRAVHEGAGIDGLLDGVVDAVSEHLLAYDPDLERDLHDDFGWLDITHGVTYAHAARWAWTNEPGPDAARLALFTAFQAHYTGRWAWRRSEVDVAAPHPVDASDPALAPDALVATALADRGGSFIVAAHDIKTTCAAIEESARSGSALPRAAVHRFMVAPRLERFVARATTQAIDFLNGRGPATRAEE